MVRWRVEGEKMVKKRRERTASTCTSTRPPLAVAGRGLPDVDYPTRAHSSARLGPNQRAAGSLLSSNGCRGRCPSISDGWLLWTILMSRTVRRPAGGRLWPVHTYAAAAPRWRTSYERRLLDGLDCH
jgi:hypothetical protein